MRALPALAVAILFAACDSSNDTLPDGGPPGDDAGSKDATVDVELPDTGTDAGLDAGGADAGRDADAAPDASTCAKTLLVGGMDIVPQGWSVISQGAFELSYAGDSTSLKTSTKPGERTSGQLLLSYGGAIEIGKPFRLQVVMLVESVSPHNQFDSAAAILGSLNGSVGTQNDRAQMLYLDSTKIGWSDDTQKFDMAVTNSAFHTYELSVDAAKVAHVSVDGVATPLTRSNFVTNGIIAIGDQTNDANVDAVMRIRSVTKMCP